jgi:hypothetical protein
MQETWWSITTDPNHIIAELLFNLIFDGLILAVGYGIIIKKIVFPYLRKNIHKYIDGKHNIEHDEY